MRLSGVGQFASLPDRGELTVYDRAVKPRTSGAYRAYRVRLSEEHALKAARPGGQMTVIAPNDETIRLVYERHIEHPDGNWTWIGRDASGADAVITFGAKAVFGSIPQEGQQPLRLTMADGRSWLIVTDGDKVADADLAAMRVTGKPDYFVPAKVALGAAADKPAPVGEQASTPAAAATALAQTRVDVLLGYTNGFAAAYGGQSQAVTRLTNLVDIANQAYTNSAVNAQLRLVGTVAVTYADDTNNGLALEELSGFNEDGPVTPHPAFAGLRAARNTLGADLVALVRDFRSPENAGCGIAWLIGGGQTPISQADAPYGYSVVSDGSDFDESDGNSYVCRDESLVHELGHNMGQAHNAADSDSPGAHAYSYGYRESSTTGFYTVMAYRLPGSDQVGIRYFANPAVNDSQTGRATGVANSADNARSMNQTIPIIATFRTAASGGSARNDVNADGKSDLLWNKSSTGNFSHWLMNGGTVTGTGDFLIGAIYDAIGSGDLDGDGYTDVIWKHRTSGQVYAWMRTPTGYLTRSISAIAGGWNLIGVVDISGDGKADLLWNKASTGQFVHWVMNGATIVSGSSYVIGASFDAIGAGDLDANGYADVIWKNRTNGQVYAWMRTPTAYSAQFISTIASGWSLAGVADVSGDGKGDLLWSKASSGQFVHWIMNGSAIVSGNSYVIGANYDAIGSGDFDGNGRADVVWRNRNNGQVYFWLRQPTQYSTVFVSTQGVEWKLLR